MFFFSSRRRHTRLVSDWSSDVCSSDLVGLYEGSKSIPVAKAKGFQVVSTAEAVRRADVIFVGLPDTKQPSVYERDIAPNLKKGKTLLFSHGFSIHFKTVVPPKDIDVILVAPKGPGHILRRQYL